MYETAASKAARGDPNWEPEWESKRFSILLRCIRCSEPVLGVGDVQSIEGHDEEHSWVFFNALVPRYFEPPIPMIQVPKDCPDVVHSEVLSATVLYWSSRSSAGNRIRAAVERLMDVLGVPNTSTLHARIQTYATTNNDIAEKLLAIKWLGNTGSHSDDLDSSDVLDAFELLEYALEELYAGRSTRLKALAGTINTHKGPPPK